MKNLDSVPLEEILPNPNAPENQTASEKNQQHGGPVASRQQKVDAQTNGSFSLSQVFLVAACIAR